MIYRQGDLLFLESNGPAPDAVEVSPQQLVLAEVEISTQQLVLAEGELTGHSHRVSLTQGARAWRKGSSLWLEGARPLRVEHEEHAPIDLPAGIFEVRQQRIYIYGPLAAID